MGAGPLGRVERKGVRRRVFESDARRRAHKVAGIKAQPLAIVIIEGHGALTLPQSLPQRFLKSFAHLLADRKAVDNQVDGMDFITVEPHSGRYFANLAVDAGINIPFLGQRLEKFAVMALAALNDGGEQGDFMTGETLEDEFGDAVVGIMHHLLAGRRRISPRRPSIEQTQEVVDFGDGAHGRTRVFVSGLLLDSHHGAQARDFVDIGPLHRADELPGISREGLHITSLTLGINRIESQRRLARAAQARDDDQLAPRNLQIDIPEVVHAGTEYLDRIFFHRCA